MSTSNERLSRDVEILVAMAAEMDAYLMRDVLFWRMENAWMPMLTLGGYLMRQNRLLALQNLLSAGEQTQVAQAVSQFNAALSEKIVRFEEKGHTEMEARIRQWGEFLKDLQWDPQSSVPNYPTSVEARAMMAALMDRLALAPYQLSPRIPEQVKLLDANLRSRWQTGEFIWPVEWQSAYPRTEFWWLYGQPGR